MIYENFPRSIYILVSVALESSWSIQQKADFMLKWIQEHAKEKLAGTHSCKEDMRIKHSNAKFANI